MLLKSSYWFIMSYVYDLDSSPSSSFSSSWPPAPWGFPCLSGLLCLWDWRCSLMSSVDLSAALGNSRKQNCWNTSINVCFRSTMESHSVPLGVISGLLRAVWIISWASVFLAFKTSMVCFNSVSSESWRKKICQFTSVHRLNRVCIKVSGCV